MQSAADADVMAATDLSWHRLTLPKAAAERLRAALAGMLEDALLADTEDLHLAVAPMPKAGQPTWVAACDHTWLTSQLMALEKAKKKMEDQKNNKQQDPKDQQDSAKQQQDQKLLDKIAELKIKT